MQSSWPAAGIRYGNLTRRANQGQTSIIPKLRGRPQLQQQCTHLLVGGLVHCHRNRAHLRGKDDGVTVLRAVRERFPDFAGLLASEPDLFDRLRSAESIAWPLGDDRFLARLQRVTGRVLKPGKRGPRPSEPEQGQE